MAEKVVFSGKNVKMLKEKHDEWVLETVDCLRQRKARPDLGRISRMVERFHGLTVNETKESLERLTTIGVVMKVYFKGNISYRHVKRANKGPETKSSPNNPVYNTSVRIEQAIKSIVKQTGKGASFSDLEAWLISKNPETRLVKHRLETALKREINSGTVVQLGNESYILIDQLKEQLNVTDQLKNVNVEQNEPETQADLQSPSTSTVNGSVSCINDTTVTGEQPKRGRPLSKRKKFKKTHGPDFEMPSQMKRSQSKEEGRNTPPVCGYCSNTAESNSDGVKEPLLTCKDCDAKAHPSCMDYSPDLARRALNSPWQCMDCKTCFLCDGSENADLMLFCDACDKGYHMTCHEPPLMNKPKGKWVCSLCQYEMCSDFNLEETRHRLGAAKSGRLSECSNDGEEDIYKKGKKRKLGRPKSVPGAKRVKTSPDSSDTSKQNYDGYIDGTVGASCILTPSASPRPSDTFDYEMKMSQLGLPVSIIEDTTTYSDATNWNTDEVVKFFEDCGFQEHAQAFKEQEIDGRSLLLMQRNDVLTGLGIKLGPALKIYHKVVKLQIYSQLSAT